MTLKGRIGNPENVLAISARDDEIGIFDDYCKGIRMNSGSYHYIDYIELYLKNGRPGFNRHVLEFVKANDIGLVFLIIRSGDVTFDVGFLEELSLSAKLVINFFDTEHYFDAVDKYYAQAADLVTLPAYLPVLRFELLNINAMCTFSLLEAEKYKRRAGNAKTIDVSFVGNVLKADRKGYIGHLSENGIKVLLFGKGTEKGFVSFDEMADIFNGSRINLNFNSTADNDLLILGESINNRIYQIKGRITEITLSGGFALTEYVPGIERMYEIDKEIAVFRDKKELLDKIRYYLENEGQREEIARRGHERAIRDYDAAEGYRRVFEYVRQCERNDIPVYTDLRFINNYTSYRFYYMARFIIRLKFGGLIGEAAMALKHKRFSPSKAYRYIKLGISHELNRYPALKGFLKKALRIKTKGT